MLSKIKNIFLPDSEAIKAAKALPDAYRDMLGLDFMVCVDPEDFDWSGLGDPIALAEVKSADNDTGKFNFFFLILPDNEQDPFERFKSEMTVKQVESAFLFTSKSEETEVKTPVTSENLKPVLEMALRNRQKVRFLD